MGGLRSGGARQWQALAGLGSSALALLGCVNQQPAAYPLFDDEPLDGTAIVVGDIASVDGKGVAGLGHRFAVAAGCHTITNVKTWGGNDNTAAIMAHLPEMPFRLEMKAGHTYVLRISISGPAQEGARLVVEVEEQDAQGNQLGSIGPGSHC